nr:TPA_asm: m23.1 uORF 1 RNA *1 [Murid betaherpesvirus 1]DBA07740.1 TPA_asm: m23.1 uORF 1 RNA *1 [Murid betaherpesvirus 1]
MPSLTISRMLSATWAKASLRVRSR